MAEAEQGAIDLSGLWVAVKKARIVGTLLTHALAGRAVAVWAPEVVPAWSRRTVAVSLVRAALADVTRKGFRVAQALVDRTSPRSARGDLSGGGLPRVTQLIYMARPTAPSLPVPASVPRFLWQSYGPETDAEFRRVLDTTYHGSLDMPELEGVRSLDDVIAAHRAGGRFDPTRWRIGHLPDDPAATAIVLLTAQAERGSWEVAYLGLSPASRGRGLGRVALSYALELARPHAPRLELAVDARNTPAFRLYRRAGFHPFDRRSVHLRVLSP
ncbi:MAG: acetyltransferase [Planctomycetota bacterium]|nr:acetyltransferase [Planctomycetota bacterium]